MCNDKRFHPIRGVSAGILILMVMLMAFPAYAKAIDKVSLTLYGNKPLAGNSVSPIICTTNSSGYYVESCEYTDSSGYWDSDGDATCIIDLVTFDDNVFSNVHVTINGMNAKVSGINAQGSQRLFIQVSIPVSAKNGVNSSVKDNGVVWLDKVSNPHWSGTTAKWNTIKDAKKYEIHLYRDNNTIATYMVSGSSHDFKGDMVTGGSYYFKIRALNGAVKGGWSDPSDEYRKDININPVNSNYSNYSDYPNPSPYQSPNSYSTGAGSLSSSVLSIQTDHGWRQDAIGWRYKNFDGSFPRNTWQIIDGNWYCFDEQGYVRTGWIYWNHNAYFCGSNGAMYSNTYTPDGYYVDASGAWVPGIAQKRIAAGPG